MNSTDSFKLQKIEELLATLLTIIQHSQSSKSSLGILTQKELLQQLNIAPNTLKSWENKGLKRLEPPIEGTRTVYYKLSDVLRFLSQ
jgi:hypothetical protein